MRGPYPIVCRAHSGGRLLSEIYIRNGIQMGNVHDKTKDTSYFVVRRNNNVYHLISNADIINQNISSQIDFFKEIGSSLINKFIETEKIYSNKPFGWKYGETLYVLPFIFEKFPTMKAVHLIRDGRDVMLSRIPARFAAKRFHEKWNRFLVLGDKEKDSFKGHFLNKEIIEKYRTELEFIHWVNVVKFSKKLKKFKGQFLEISYEDLCANPDSVLDQLEEYLGLVFNDASRKWARENASTARIGKWKKEDITHIKSVTKDHWSLLEEYGYNF